MDDKKLLNVLLLPRDFYRKLTDKRISLVIGIILVGIVDLSVTVIENYSKLFSGKTQGDFIYNVSVIVMLVLLMGLIDVIFFNVPLFDLFKKFKKETEIPSNSWWVIKLMKIYIITNLITYPFSLVIYLLSKNIDIEQNIALANVLFLAWLLTYLWFYCIITRGINSIYQFEPLFKRLVFPVVFLWGYVLSKVMFYLIDEVALKFLFK